MNTKPLLSIIIPTKDRGTIFNKTFAAAYKAIENVDAEIIIVNDSKTSTVTIDESHGRITIIDNPKQGVASARNLGAKIANSDLLLFLDDDIIIDEKNLLSTIELYKNNDNICYNPNWTYPPELDERIRKTQFGRYLIKFGFTTLQGWNPGLIWDANKPFEVNMVASYYLPVYKSIFEKVGGYNEDFPHAGAEDHDFATRLKAFGVKAFINPSVIVFHKEEDRISLKDWLKRKERGGETRKIAFNLGHKDQLIKHNFYKSVIYYLIGKKMGFFKWILNSIPNNKSLDGIYFRFVNMLLAASLYKGFRKNS